jgi:uncharacterized repeat protein (TIGR04138 family)
LWSPYVEAAECSPEVRRWREAALRSSLDKDRFERVAAVDLRYTKEAFRFVRDGVARAMQSEGGRVRHVDAKKLLEALRSLAVERYGFGAREQLRLWGVTRCEDFGEIVFTLIEHGIFGKQPGDKKEDFADGYDFETAFPTGEESGP